MLAFRHDYPRKLDQAGLAEPGSLYEYAQGKLVICVGLVALSLAPSPRVREKGRFAEISRADYPPIRQACIIRKSSRNKEIARQYLEFMKTPAISALSRDYGFDIPDRSAANR